MGHGYMTVVSHGIYIYTCEESSIEILVKMLAEVDKETMYLEGLRIHYEMNWDNGIFICPLRAICADARCGEAYAKSSSDLSLSDEVKKQLNNLANYLRNIYDMNVIEYLNDEIFVYAFQDG
jgi:hypothetical protein